MCRISGILSRDPYEAVDRNALARLIGMIGYQCSED
jgi:hypothetical protein